MPVEYRALIF